MGNSIYRKMIFERVNAMKASSRVLSEEVSSPKCKGQIRELFLSLLIKPLLPASFSVSKNCIVLDCYDEKSGEIDLVIYNKHHLPPLFFENIGDVSFIPRESSVYAIEVKSLLTKSEIRKTAKACKVFIKQKSAPKMSRDYENADLFFAQHSIKRDKVEIFLNLKKQVEEMLKTRSIDPLFINYFISLCKFYQVLENPKEHQRSALTIYCSIFAYSTDSESIEKEIERFVDVQLEECETLVISSLCILGKGTWSLLKKGVKEEYESHGHKIHSRKGFDFLFISSDENYEEIFSMLGFLINTLQREEHRFMPDFGNYLLKDKPKDYFE